MLERQSSAPAILLLWLASTTNQDQGRPQTVMGYEGVSGLWFPAVQTACWACARVRSGKESVMVVMGLSTMQ